MWYSPGNGIAISPSKYIPYMKRGGHNMANCRANLPRRENTILTTLCETHLYSQEYHHKQGAAPEGGDEKEYHGKGARHHYLPSPQLSNKTKQTNKKTHPGKTETKTKKKNGERVNSRNLFSFLLFLCFSRFFEIFFWGFRLTQRCTIHWPESKNNTGQEREIQSNKEEKEGKWY